MNRTRGNWNTPIAFSINSSDKNTSTNATRRGLVIGSTVRPASEMSIEMSCKEQEISKNKKGYGGGNTVISKRMDWRDLKKHIYHRLYEKN